MSSAVRSVRISAPTIVPPNPPRPPRIDVPPMTAAATDGSTADSTSAGLAVLFRPAMRKPASAARIADSV